MGCSVKAVKSVDTIDHATKNMDLSADILARAMFFQQKNSNCVNCGTNDFSYELAMPISNIDSEYGIASDYGFNTVSDYGF